MLCLNSKPVQLVTCVPFLKSGRTGIGVIGRACCISMFRRGLGCDFLPLGPPCVSVGGEACLSDTHAETPPVGVRVGVEKLGRFVG